MSIHCIHISVDFDKAFYRGVVLSDCNGELLRCNTGHFPADFLTIFRHAMRIRHGRVLCYDNSVFIYRQLLRLRQKLHRTKWNHKIEDHGKIKRSEAQEAVEIGIFAPEEGCDEGEAIGIFEQEED